MNEHRRHWLLTSSLGTAGALLGMSGCSHALTPKSSSTMDTRNWQTHCFGRHLLSLPLDAKVADAYKLDGNAIEWLQGIKPVQIPVLMDRREQELRAQAHRVKQQTDGSQFIERIPMANQGGVIYSWPSEVAQETNLQEIYLTAATSGTVSRLKRTISSDRRKSGLAWAEKIQQALTGRDPNVIPEQSGFCMKSAMLTGSKPVAEEAYRLWVTFASLPRVGLTVESWQVGEPSSDTLFSRMPAGLSALMNLASGTSVLRKREVLLGQQTAQEMLLRVKAEGKRAYHFQLETVGVANSATETSLTFEMSTTNILDEHGHVGDAAFKDDEEAQAFWDAILHSFKVRPGAV